MSPTPQPSPIINCDLLFIKDAVRALEMKTGDKFDVYDPDTHAVLLTCRETNVGGLIKLRRFLGGQYDSGGPFNLCAINAVTGEQVVRMMRRPSLFSFGFQPVEFFGVEDTPLCSVKKKWLTFSHIFMVATSPNRPLFEVHVRIRPRAFGLYIQDVEVAALCTTWKGRAEAYFSSGFKYALTISGGVPRDSIVREFLLAFALCFDRLRR